ncbi:EamA family transporter [Paludicola sp. MB14-C6]|uniref:DMT family transporter n=1 Tax=Paludihabitans sp. MB14-C6 TaxID=3070656 RepID=UPI0027DC80D2|nr:EamA family transporter [Paludicola sp. MB14-C6]WMJ23921.1 EamA family transporter [Paludicola sp. MB14-C6]
MKTERKGILLVIVAALLWSTGGVLIKFIPLSSMAISSFRSLLGLIVIFIFYHKQKLIISKTVIISAFCLAYTLIGFVLANRFTTAASAVVLQYCSPICVAFYMFLLYKRKPKRNEVIALFGALVGIILFFFGKFSGSSLLGNVIALSAGFSFGGLFLINSRSDCDSYSSLVFGQLLTFVIGIPFLFQEDYSVVTVGSIFAILALGIFQVGIAYICFSIGIKHISPLEGNIICMIEPVLNPIWVFLFIGETLSIYALFGTVIVISSIIFLNVSQAREAKKNLVKQ